MITQVSTFTDSLKSTMATATTTYNLRRKEVKDYQALSEIKLPRPMRSKRNPEDNLYSVTVLDEKDDKVKIQYNGEMLMGLRPWNQNRKHTIPLSFTRSWL